MSLRNKLRRSIGFLTFLRGFEAEEVVLKSNILEIIAVCSLDVSELIMLRELTSSRVQLVEAKSIGERFRDACS